MQCRPRTTGSVPLTCFFTTLAVVFLVGMFLPGIQRSGHTNPTLQAAVQAILSVLFFMEYPARSWGLRDTDVAMLVLRMASTVAWGCLLGALAALCAKWWGGKA